MLNLIEGECCITIHNATASIEEACVKMKDIADQISKLFQLLQQQTGLRNSHPDPGLPLFYIL